MVQGTGSYQHVATDVSCLCANGNGTIAFLKD